MGSSISIVNNDHIIHNIPDPAYKLQSLHIGVNKLQSKPRYKQNPTTHITFIQRSL